MDGMKTNTTNLLRIFFGVALGIVLTAGVTNAQPSAASNNDANKAANVKGSQKAEKTDDKKTTKKKSEKEPSSANVGDDAGDYTITSTLEFGYRGQRVDGDINKFKSDLNYKAGPRIFDSSFLMKSKDDKSGGLFDTLMVTSTGWGADPQGNLRINMENPKWYRVEGQNRRFKYYRFVNNLANP